MTKILEKVQEIKDICFNNGQDDLLKLTEKFDKVKLQTFIYQVPENIKIDAALAESIKMAKNNIYKFHKAEYDKLLSFEDDKIETSKGIICWKKFTPIGNVGVYVPNKLFSSVLMNVIPAQIACCNNIIICTPPNPSNAVLWTLQLLGIDKVYTIGGAQAIFAMAYGVGEIPKVDKIFGPGNEFVEKAKQLVANEIAIDMPAGPSEVLVIADAKANPNAVIYDLLAQLEHGKESKAWLYCTEFEIIKFIKQNINEIAENSPRYSILVHSLHNLVIKHVYSIENAIEESNQIAPEHLILNVENAAKYLDKITNAGSVFIGGNTPESLGDYLSGTNHVLPTNGYAKAFSGLSVLSFGKFITFQKASKAGLKNIAPNVKVMADAEGLGFHAQSINRYLDQSLDESQDIKFQDDRTLVKGSTWMHYKNKLYQIIDIAYNANDPDPKNQIVIYKALYNDEHFGLNAIWSRATKDFLGRIESGEYRFVKVIL